MAEICFPTCRACLALPWATTPRLRSASLPRSSSAAAFFDFRSASFGLAARFSRMARRFASLAVPRFAFGAAGAVGGVPRAALRVRGFAAFDLDMG
jgi:hypothetical protein